MSQSSNEPGTASAWSNVENATLSLFIWLVFLVFGGGLLSMYYSRIGYFPEISWKQSLTYLAVLSILGGTVVLLYGLLLMAPGLVWSESLVHNGVLQGMLCIGDSEQPCTLTISERLAWPFAWFMLSVHLALLVEPWWQQLCIVVPLGALLVTRFYYKVMVKTGCQGGGEAPGPDGGQENSRLCIKSEYMEFKDRWNRFPKLVSRSRKYHRDCRSTWLKYTFWFALSLLAGGGSLVVVFNIASPPHRWSGGVILMLIICTVSVVLANMAFVLNYRGDRRMAFGWPFMFAVLLLISGEMISEEIALSSRIMSRFGVGPNDSYSILLTEEGRQLVRELRLPCEPASPTGGVTLDDNPIKCVDLKGTRINGARILSRLGSQYVVQMGAYKFSLPKQYVVSWLTLARASADREARGGAPLRRHRPQ